ncbi:hypothetical protein N7463_004960 [Penicillium fimorum]|uniref:Uncharacterized protein n=1 Tax=Penicillium fimorum TaxID=1882269 RepID=A0A9X0C566_9EURO|nr:hypothetical protein N7463_004960 [Penicillium fimorum]
MARFNLSFISIFLVLAVLALSMPAKRDGLAPSHSLKLDSAVNELTHATRSADGPDDNISQKQQLKAKIAEKLAEKAGLGNGSTTATPTEEPKSKFSGFGKVPLVGPIVGDIGGGL